MPRALCLTFLFILALAPQAHAQAGKICDSRFERLLAGYRIGPGELTAFLADAPALAGCRATLDPARPEHKLIDSWLLYSRGGADMPAAAQGFEALCRAGSDVACFYATHFEPGTANPLAGRAALERLRPLVAKVPAAAVAAGSMLLLGEKDLPADPARGQALLAAGAGAGDYWGSFYMALRDSPERFGRPIAGSGWQPDRIWLQRAADAGHAGAALMLAMQIGGEGDMKASFEAMQRAAKLDAKFFTTHVATAQYWLGFHYRMGIVVPADETQARRWLQSAAALGNPQAKPALQLK